MFDVGKYFYTTCDSTVYFFIKICLKKSFNKYLTAQKHKNTTSNKTHHWLGHFNALLPK